MTHDVTLWMHDLVGRDNFKRDLNQEPSSDIGFILVNECRLNAAAGAGYTLHFHLTVLKGASHFHLTVLRGASPINGRLKGRFDVGPPVVAYIGRERYDIP